MGASALRRSDGRSSTIGVLLEDLSNPFSATMYREIEQVAGERSVSVLGGSLDENTEREHELTTSLSRHRVDGVIMAPASHDHRYLRQDQEAGIPFIFVDRPPVLLTADSVLSTSREGAAVGVNHLISMGHRSIGYLGDAATIWTARERHIGYRGALERAGLAIDESFEAHGVRTSEAARQIVKEMLGTQVAPTAFFASQNLLTIGTVRALRDLGLQRSVALVGFDDFVLADLLDPAVTVVAQDVVTIARTAVQMLFRRIDGDNSETQRVHVATRLIQRGSGEIAPPS